MVSKTDPLTFLTDLKEIPLGQGMKTMAESVSLDILYTYVIELNSCREQRQIEKWMKLKQFEITYNAESSKISTMNRESLSVTSQH